jgi:hypothetical protein
MYRSGFERVCDVLANMQTSLSEGVQWAFTALFLGVATTLLVRTIVVA